MPTVRELNGEDFKNHNLADDCTRFDVLLAVVERASSLYDEAKKKGKDSKPKSSFLKRKFCSAEKNSCFGVSMRKDDAFCFQTVSSGPKNQPDLKVYFPIKKRPLPVEDDTADGINNYEGISKKKRRKNQMDLGMIDYFNPIDEILLRHEPPPFDHHLPIEYKETIKSLNQGLTVEKEILVIQKALTATDISSHQNRFSIPLNQIINSSFLNDDEIKILKSREENGKKVKKLEINLIDPMQKEWSVKLARWVMNKPDPSKKMNVTDNESADKRKGGGGVSISYVINGPWAKIVDSNKLKEGDVMQLWGFVLKDLCGLFLLSFKIKPLILDLCQ